MLELLRIVSQGTSTAATGAPKATTPAQKQRDTARALAEEAAAHSAAKARQPGSAGAPGRAATPPPPAAAAPNEAEAGSGPEEPQRMSVAQAVAAAEAARAVDFDAEPDELVYELDDFPSM